MILANHNGTVVLVEPVKSNSKYTIVQEICGGSIFKLTGKESHRKIFSGKNAVDDAIQWINEHVAEKKQRALAAKYPLDVKSVGSDSYIVMSKGHHDFDLFMSAVHRAGYDWPLGIPEHRWVKSTPDRTGNFKSKYSFVPEGTRGAWPATFTWETYGEGLYTLRKQVKLATELLTRASETILRHLQNCDKWTLNEINRHVHIVVSCLTIHHLLELDEINETTWPGSGQAPLVVDYIKKTKINAQSVGHTKKTYISTLHQIVASCMADTRKSPKVLNLEMWSSSGDTTFGGVFEKMIHFAECMMATREASSINEQRVLRNLIADQEPILFLFREAIKSFIEDGTIRADKAQTTRIQSLLNLQQQVIS